MELIFENKKLAEVTKAVSQVIHDNNGEAYLVGGCIRDALLGKKIKEIDMEVYGITQEKLTNVLATSLSIPLSFNFIGKSFGVIKVSKYPIDISFPRKERQIFDHHKGFQIHTDVNMSKKEACKRRDFTINSMLYSLHTHTIIDHYDGQKDLNNRILRHTSTKFQEDPLRVLRAMQFIARFELTIAPQTLDFCKKLSIENIPQERIYEEFKKLILKGNKLSLGLFFLKECEWIKFFPEIAQLINCPQHPVWHPEGDVFIHTALCLDVFSQKKTYNAKEDLIVGMAVLCHDMGKPLTTVVGDDGIIRSPAHDIKGVPVARKFLKRLTNDKKLIDAVLPLVETHMLPSNFYKNNASKSAILKLAHKIKNIHRLLRVTFADHNGRGQKINENPDSINFISTYAKELDVYDTPPLPLVQGKDLINMGIPPGKHFAIILEECYRGQLNHTLKSSEETLQFIRKHHLKKYSVSDTPHNN